MLVLLTVSGASATPVGSLRARQTAETFWQAQGMKGSLAERPTEFAHLYLYVGEEGGFVVVSGDDCARPVLAWSADAPTDDTLHPALRYWLDGYDRQIARAVALGVQTSPEWRSPKNGAAVTTVGPLLTTRWNQGDYYNNQCPTVGGEHCYTGCVATATAQVMKYHNHPATGQGSHSYTSQGTQSANFGATTYAWNQMPDRLTATSTSAQIAAVAQLMYHVGVAVEMNYGTDVSTATTDSYGYFDVCAENALKQYFGYSNTVRSLSRGAYSQQAWVNVIEAEIDSLRPVIYSGRGISAGHTFVCDGHDNYHRLHINWGWGGLYDGWFLSDALVLGGSGIGGNSDDDYRMRQSIIIGIKPSTAAPASQYTVTVSASTGGTVSGGGTYNAGASATLSATASNGYRFDRWSDGVGWNPRTLPVCGNMNLTAQFVSITGSDTLQLDNGTSMFYSTASASTTFPASLMAGHQQLTAVMYYPTNAGSHTVTVNYGNNQTYTKSEVPVSPGLWNTMYLDDTILLSTSYPVTVTLTPAQGTVVSMVGGAPIRLICDGMFRPHRLDVRTSNTYFGYVTGGGYYVGNPATVTITAVPIDTVASFMMWSDGDTSNPRVVQLTSDTVFTAMFRAPGFYYLNAYANNTSLGYVTDFNGWQYAHTCNLGSAYDCTTTEALATPKGRFVGWNYDTTGLSVSRTLHPYNLHRITIDSINRDTLNLEAEFAPVNNNDTLRYDNGPFSLFTGATIVFNNYNDPTPQYRWGVKYDPSALTGCTHISQVNTYLLYSRNTSGHAVPLTYTIQVYQGGNDSPQTLLGTKTISTGYSEPYRPTVLSDGDTWRRVTFYPPLAIDNTQPVWVVVNCTREGSNRMYMPYGKFSGNLNSNYVWTQQTGWTHYISGYAANALEDDYYRGYHDYYCTWLIRSYTGSQAKADVSTKVVYYYENGTIGQNGCTVTGGGERSVGTTATLTATPSSGCRFDHWEWRSAEDQTITGQSTDNPVSFTVTGDIYYIAHFVDDTAVCHIYVRTNNDAWGSATGGGNYHAGDVVTLTAIPNNGYHFWRWIDDDQTSAYTTNPYVFTVPQGMVGYFFYYAYFVPDGGTEGIDEADNCDFRIHPHEGRIIVEGAEDEEVKVYDMMGRSILNGNLPKGVYMVKIGTRPARKVVVW